MNRIEYICLLAQYNQAMNAALYKTAMDLSDEELAADKGAFFSSILGTLNHIAVGDTIWLQRFAVHPAGYVDLKSLQGVATPKSLDEILYADLASLLSYRQSLDQVISAWAPSISEQDLDHVLHYSNSKGVAFDRVFFGLVMHFFNHQTHHRGQATTLLSQAGLDVGVTDLMTFLPTVPSEE